MLCGWLPLPPLPLVAALVLPLQEPVAAALAYGFGAPGQSDTLAVFDFGGGTFDVSVVDAFECIMEVMGQRGWGCCGGQAGGERGACTQHTVDAMTAHSAVGWARPGVMGCAVAPDTRMLSWGAKP